MAEAHPVGFQWVMEAKARGATVIHVDPRFSRTSAMADMFVPLRAGSDVAFLGGIVNYILSNEKEFREYVVAYTNAATIVSDDFQDTEDLDGLFSGYEPDKRGYDVASWQYAGQEGDASRHDTGPKRETAGALQHESHGVAVHRRVGRDDTLEHPRCVYQILKRHFARYTPEMVEQVTGVSPEQFLAVCEAWTANSGRERTTAFVYSVGWTQHTVGVQYIRTAAIIQLLLGNMGRPGGGIMALRGHASIQGSTDIPTLFNLLPGYLPMPHHAQHATFDAWIDSMFHPGQKGFWSNAKSYAVSLLKAYWGDAANQDNDFGYGYLPRMTGDHGTYQQVFNMIDGTVKGYFLLGQNPAVGSAHGKAQRLGMANLDWLVVRDLYLIESSTFWKDSPEVATGEIVPEECRTEVFFLPAASHVEKDGTFTQTQRLLQWREKALDPPGRLPIRTVVLLPPGSSGARAGWLGRRCGRDRAVLDLTWDYPLQGVHNDPSAESVLKEINGYEVATGRPLSAYTELKSDGSTVGGCWIYTGVFADGVNQANRRKPGSQQSWVAPEWGWAWPANRRILYNRASADPAGRPWSERKAYVWWDDEHGEWAGHDVPDFEKTKAPTYRPPDDALGPAALAGDDAFIMQGDGKGWLYVPAGLIDGPMPTHYEPAESPVSNAFYGQRDNPTRMTYLRPDNPMHPPPPDAHADVFPYVFTTSRLTEHHTAGGMSRTLAYLSELQPAMFIEVSPQLAAERGLVHLGWAHAVTARSAVEGRVLVTDRLRPLRVEGRTIHQVWLPYHWGGNGLTTGDSANDLFGVTLDPNVLIQESKVGTCDIRPGRRPTGPELLAYVADYRRRAGLPSSAKGNDGERQ